MGIEAWRSATSPHYPDDCYGRPHDVPTGSTWPRARGRRVPHFHFHRGRIDGAAVEAEDPGASTFRIEHDVEETLSRVTACIPSVFEPIDRDREAGWILVQYRYLDRDREPATARLAGEPRPGRRTAGNPEEEVGHANIHTDRPRQWVP